MQVVTGAMGSLIPKLWDLLKEEYNLQKGVKDQIKSLHLELEHAHDALCKVAMEPPEQLDKQVKLWASEIREASYDMEDILDTFLVAGIEGGPRDPADGKMKQLLKMGNLFSKSKARHKIGGAIKDMKKRIQEVTERRGSYAVNNIGAAPAATRTVDPRLAAMYKTVDQLIGIDKARSELMSMVRPYQEDNDTLLTKKVHRVSVVGGGGLGKTTLVKAVYDELKSRYHCAAFVPVGRNPDLRKVFKDILIDLDKQHYTTNFNITELDERQLIEELQEFLKLKRYLIVIDDIWESESWDIIKLALFENNFGSRIITTTRNFEVARESGEVYQQQPLSHENSQKLFYTRIFGDEGKCPNNQPDMISDRFLKKCDGIPLAIITMASLLVDKPRESWSQVYNFFGFGSKDNRHVENTMRILSFSYYDLPPHLRTCLLYLSAFPEDSFIEKDSLIWKWIAEGFVHEERGRSAFEVGEGYFKYLINKSLIQEVSIRWSGSRDACRVHDMVLDLLHSIASEENFIVRVFGNNDENPISRNNVRRLVHRNITSSHTNYTDMPHVRSFIANMSNYDDFFLPSRFKLLRVLVIEDCPYKKEGYSLEYVGNLLHLRYLELGGTSISELPEEIGDLKFLQTLDIRQTGIKVLPLSMGLLTRLSCLRVKRTMSLLEGIIGKLTSLEMLDQMGIMNDDNYSKRQVVKELGSLKKLRVFDTFMGKMDDESLQIDLVESLRSMQKIQELAIYGHPRRSAVWEVAGFVLPHSLRFCYLFAFIFSRLPSCINPTCLPNLSRLSLSVVAMDEQDMKILGGLPELRYLSLATTSTITVSGIAADVGCFHKLRWFIMNLSMLWFTYNNKDSEDISLHIWNGKDAMPFSGSENKDVQKAPPKVMVMPSVERIHLAVHVRALYDANGGCGSLGLEYLSLLKNVAVIINCGGASMGEVEEVEAALRHAMTVHPNRPTPKIIKDKRIR